MPIPDVKPAFASGEARPGLPPRRQVVQALGLALAAWALPLHRAWAKTGLDILLARNAPARLNPAEYLVSEKLDGVRAVWDGQKLRFRSGRTIPAPPWFLAKLPRAPLDGELWLARGKFDQLSGMVRKEKAVDADWRQIKYVLYELPGAEGDFQQRHARLRALARAANWDQLMALEQSRVATLSALHDRLRQVVASGGEGLMLHRSNAPYVTGRSEVLLKLKAVADAEAEVIAHIPGKGKYKGMLGALDVQTLDGKRFKLGTGFTDAQRQNPPPVGSLVTYTYRDLTPSGVPRFASFLRVAEPK